MSLLKFIKKKLGLNNSASRGNASTPDAANGSHKASASSGRRQGNGNSVTFERYSAKDRPRGEEWRIEKAPRQDADKPSRQSRRDSSKSERGGGRRPRRGDDAPEAVAITGSRGASEPAQTPAPAAIPTRSRRRRGGRGRGDASEQPPREGRRNGRAPREREVRREDTPQGASETAAPSTRPALRVEPTQPDMSDWDATSFSVEPKEGFKRFHDFELPPQIMRAIHQLGFEYCTPIQAETLGLTMAGRNVAGRAQTGTGKTAAFLISILKRMMANPDSRPTEIGKPSALVIGPTRELVIQIAKDAEELGRYCGLRSIAVYGGMDYGKQQDEIAAQPLDLIVATPGRLLDFRRQRLLDLRQVHTLVIDEADRMLDMGFIPDVRKIIRELPARDQRQTLLFSATLDSEVMRLASQWMPDPVQIAVEPENATVETITQLVYPIAKREKLTVLYNLLKKYETERVLVFRNRRIGCERLMGDLIGQGIACEILTGDVAQKKRLRVLEDFRSGKIKVLVATDVAGRGIHVEDIALVVNYDFPYEPDDYIHRIGRTGRAGHTGTAISFACEDESFIIPDIEELLGEELPCQQPDEELLVELPRSIRRPRTSRPPRSPRR